MSHFLLMEVCITLLQQRQFKTLPAANYVWISLFFSKMDGQDHVCCCTKRESRSFMCWGSPGSLTSHLPFLLPSCTRSAPGQSFKPKDSWHAISEGFLPSKGFSSVSCLLCKMYFAKIYFHSKTKSDSWLSHMSLSKTRSDIHMTAFRHFAETPVGLEK